MSRESHDLIFVARLGRACSIGAVRARGNGARRQPLARITLGLALVASALPLSVTACSTIEPEVGERLSACVDADSDPNVTVSFKDKIRPLMDGTFAAPRPCMDCHYASRGTKEGFEATGLNLETLGSLRKGGIHTADDIVVPGQPCKSAIVQKLKARTRTRACRKADRTGTPNNSN